MRTVKGAAIAAWALGAGAGCDQVQALLQGPPPPVEACVAVDKLEGTTWILDQILPGGATHPQPQARLQFYREGEDLKAKYTALSLGDVYDYTCAKHAEDELLCRQKPRALAVCKALEVHQKGSCTPRKIAELGLWGMPEGDDLKKVIDEARAEVDKARPTAEWKKYAVVHNNVGHAIQGFMYVKVQPKKCNIRVQDLFYTVHDGVRKEDSNPVGTNDFIKGTADYRWTGCDNDRLVDLDAPTRVKPNEIPPQRPHTLGQEVHFLYYGDAGLKPEEGCNYTFDGFASAVRVASASPVQVGPDGALDWRASYTFSDPIVVQRAEPPGVVSYEMERYKTCGGGARERIDTVCRVMRLE